jgi:hypothetical protein
MRVARHTAGLLFSMICGFALGGPAMAQTAWTSDPIITSEKCTDLSYEKAVSFLNSHFIPAVAFLSDSKASEVQLLQAYAVSTALTVRSQQCLAEALELKEIGDKLRSEQAVIKSGTSLGKNEIEKQRKLSEEADELIRTAMTQERKLTPEQRKSFSIGAATYLASAYATSQLFQAAEKTVQDNKGKGKGLGGLGGGLGGLKDAAQSAKYALLVGEIAKGVGAQVKRLGNTSKSLVAYAKTNNIELPADATSKLDSLVKWDA